MPLPACSQTDERDKDLQEVEIPQLNKQRTPSSQRSQRVVQRVAPRLITELKEHDLEFGAPVFIRIFKQERQLELWIKGKERYQLFRTYPIAAMSGQLGPKLKQGDRQAPEGFYFVNAGRMNPSSRFHLSFNLGYPNSYDRARGRTGSALMVHGSHVSIGCFAMTDAMIEEIYTLSDAALRNGQKLFRVHSFPFRMSLENIRKHRESEWIRFWLNLKPGYDWFEEKGAPPDVGVEGKRYTFKKSEE